MRTSIIGGYYAFNPRAYIPGGGVEGYERSAFGE